MQFAIGIHFESLSKLTLKYFSSFSIQIKSLFKFLQASQQLQLPINESTISQLLECVNISFSNSFIGFSDVCNLLHELGSGISEITSVGKFVYFLSNSSLWLGLIQAIVQNLHFQAFIVLFISISPCGLYIILLSSHI